MINLKTPYLVDLSHEGCHKMARPLHDKILIKVYDSRYSITKNPIANIVSGFLGKMLELSYYKEPTYIGYSIIWSPVSFLINLLEPTHKIVFHSILHVSTHDITSHKKKFAHQKQKFHAYAFIYMHDHFQNLIHIPFSIQTVYQDKLISRHPYKTRSNY